MPRSSHWIRTSTRLARYIADDYTCAYCGVRADSQQLFEEAGVHADLTIDHVVWNGGNDWSNLVTCCRSCNESKGAGTVADVIRREHLDEATVKQRLRIASKRRQVAAQKRAGAAINVLAILHVVAPNAAAHVARVMLGLEEPRMVALHVTRTMAERIVIEDCLDDLDGCGF